MKLAGNQVRKKSNTPSVTNYSDKNSGVKLTHGFADNRPETVMQRKLVKIANSKIINSEATESIQLKTNNVVQRTVDSAAEVLYKSGTITVKKSDLKGKFLTAHNVKQSDLADIQKALNKLREEAGPKEAFTQVDMTDSTNWPTAGGMVEGDGATLANHFGWTEDNSSWKCSDSSHTPKGKVYIDGNKNYYGADNTGHVGWGFKIWHKKNKTTLDYVGNYSWNGVAWGHDARGTGKTMK